jgi:triphosphoribosyl-dephospho-CoA synthetase
MMRRIYAQSASLGNRVGLHYNRFWLESNTPLVANQILSQIKNLEIRVFDRESANSG